MDPHRHINQSLKLWSDIRPFLANVQPTVTCLDVMSDHLKTPDHRYSTLKTTKSCAGSIYEHIYVHSRASGLYIPDNSVVCKRTAMNCILRLCKCTHTHTLTHTQTHKTCAVHTLTYIHITWLTHYPNSESLSKQL